MHHQKPSFSRRQEQGLGHPLQGAIGIALGFIQHGEAGHARHMFRLQYQRLVEEGACRGDALLLAGDLAQPKAWLGQIRQRQAGGLQMRHSLGQMAEIGQGDAKVEAGQGDILATIQTLAQQRQRSLGLAG